MANIGYIQLTRLCNQKCRFCSNPEREATLSKNEVRSKLEYFIKNNYSGVILTGGEPTLHPDLPEIISMVRDSGLQVKLITNGQKTADRKFLAALKKAGLDSINVSIQSYRKDVQNYLADNPDSFDNLCKTLRNVEKLGMSLNINTTINAYNADHIHETASWIIRTFPTATHFVWNNLDPLMNRATENPDTIAKLSDFELSLYLAMELLCSKDRTFRVERVPLCYMPEHAQFSTETRKIVKSEERTVFFLDEKARIRQKKFFYDKAEPCSSCLVSPICAGLYQADKYYDSAELFPLFIEPQTIIDLIEQDDDS